MKKTSINYVLGGNALTHLHGGAAVPGGGASSVNMFRTLVDHKHKNEHLVARSVHMKEYLKRSNQAFGVVGGMMEGGEMNYRWGNYYGQSPKTTRLVVKRNNHRGQVKHWSQQEDKFDIFRVNLEKTHLESRQAGGLIFQRVWDSSVGYENEHLLCWVRGRTAPNNDRVGTPLSSRKETTMMAEKWGLRMVEVDPESNAGPRWEYLKKRKHPLYADNFPYLGMNGNKVNTHLHGDADFGWRGTFKPDYSVHGAKSKVGNFFRPSAFDAIRNTPFYNKAQVTPAALPPAPQEDPEKTGGHEASNWMSVKSM